MNPGEILDGRYEIVARLGAGGMGEVYKATHTFLGAPRVIKVVHPQIAGNTDAKERFLREARIATKVQHPNVATLHDFASLPDGSHYMVWEFIEGENLAQRLRTRGTLPPRPAVRIVIQALHGLEAIHRAGIVHRDISPENLMITPDEMVKIIDLGVAKIDDPDAVSQTRTGIFVGKLRYASPEQLGFLAEGEKIDGRTDLYALAMVATELLTGRPPYEAKSPHEYFLRHADELRRTTVVLPPEIPGSDALRDVLEKALSRDRNQRFATAAGFAAALEDIERALPDRADAPTVVVPIGGSRTTSSGTLERETAAMGGASAPTERIAPATLRTPLPLASTPAGPAKGRRVALFAALAGLLALAGGAFALWPTISEAIRPEPPRPLAAVSAPVRPPAGAVTVTPREEAVVETAAPEPATAEPQVLQKTTPPAAVEQPVEVSDEERERPRRPAYYVDGPGRRMGNDRAFEQLREELRGVNEVALRAGSMQVTVFRALKRQIPDLQFADHADVVIRFDGTPERLRTARQHLAAAATIEKNGRVIFRYELSSVVSSEAAADAFAQTIADAFE